MTLSVLETQPPLFHISHRQKNTNTRPKMVRLISTQGTHIPTLHSHPAVYNVDPTSDSYHICNNTTVCVRECIHMYVYCHCTGFPHVLFIGIQNALHTNVLGLMYRQQTEAT